MEPHPNDTPGHDNSDADTEVRLRLSAARRVLVAIAAGAWAPDPGVLYQVARLIDAAEQWIGSRDAAA